MKILTSLVIGLIFIANLVFAQPSLADKPKFLKNPDYIEVTKALDSLKTAKDTQAQVEGYTPEELQQKIDELEFQKYALETGVNWGQCRNETGKTLAVYGPAPDFDDDDYNYSYDNALYFLADGQTTKKKWDCQGVYLPSGVTAAGINPEGQSQEIAEPLAVKVADGTQLVVKTNPETAAIEFSIPPTQVLKANEANWFIPNVSQAVIESRVPNAPTAKISKANQLVVMKPEKDTAKSNIAPETQPQPEPQAQSQQSSQKSSYFKKI